MGFRRKPQAESLNCYKNKKNMAELSNGVNKKIIVSSILGILILVFSFLFWSFLAGAVSDGPDWVSKSVWSLVTFLFLGVFTGLFFLVENEKIILYSVPLIIALPALAFLKLEIITALVLVAAILFFVVAVSHVDSEKSLRIKFSAGIILRRVFPSMMTGLALLTTLFFYWAPYTQSLGSDVSIPRQLFDTIAKPAMDFSLNLSLPKGVKLESLPPEFAAQQARLMDSLYSSANDQLVLAGWTFKKWIPLGASISLFFSFKVLGFFLSWLMTFLAWLIFKIFLWGGVVRIEKIAVEKEIIKI